MANRSPPMPSIIGATRPMAAFAATAASMALPPRSRTAVPARAAIGCSAATIPYWEITMERACERSSAATGVISSKDIDAARPAAISGMVRHWRMRRFPGLAPLFRITALGRCYPMARGCAKHAGDLSGISLHLPAGVLLHLLPLNLMPKALVVAPQTSQFNRRHGQPRLRPCRDHAGGASQSLCVRYFPDGGERRRSGALLDRARVARYHSA